MAEVKGDDGVSYRTFVCHTLNAWNYPAKDRSGRLDVIEEPNLGRLMEKISGPAKPVTERLDFAGPLTTNNATTVTAEVPEVPDSVTAQPNISTQPTQET